MPSALVTGGSSGIGLAIAQMLAEEGYALTLAGRKLDRLEAAREGLDASVVQADVASETIIFPLGPALFLSWANCEATVGRDHTKVYRCELKPEYQFPGTSTEQDQRTSQDESSRERNTITLE